MLTCITGLPGSGKTALMVSMILEETKKENPRPIYVHGVPELTVPHIALVDPLDWMALPDGSLVVIDEVQRIWPTAPSGQKLHPSVEALQTHRHRGFDFIILSQGPQLIHTAVRAQIKRHIHLRDLGVMGRWWYEWPELSINVGSSWKNAVIKKRYKLPKKIFDSYRSATIHTKSTFTVPRAIYYLAAALVLFAVLAYFFYGRMKTKLEPNKPTTQIQNSTGQPVQLGGSLPDERIDFIPRVFGRPWTAPAYDSIRQVVAMPKITGAICVNDKCTCYDIQFKLDMTDKECRQWTIDRPFNPYVQADNQNRDVHHPQSAQQLQHNAGQTTANPFAAAPTM